MWRDKSRDKSLIEGVKSIRFLWSGKNDRRKRQKSFGRSD